MTSAISSGSVGPRASAVIRRGGEIAEARGDAGSAGDLDRTPRPRARAFGHGKVILLGDHAVVYGHPAVAAALSRGVSAEAAEGVPGLTVPGMGLVARPHDGTPAGAVLGAILDRMGVSDVAVHLESDLPIGAGLGSSAAMAAAVAGAIARLRGLDDALARAGAEAAEVVAHGTPSGIDLGAAWSGEVGHFQRGAGWRPLHLQHPLSLCVGLTGRSRDTRIQVAAVRRLCEQTPFGARLVDLLGEVATAGEAALIEGRTRDLGRLFDVAQGLLAALGVSSAEIETLVHAARAAGAEGAKLTGAGGGGAVIALAPGGEEAVLARWRSIGFEGFVATIGGAASVAPSHRDGHP